MHTITEEVVVLGEAVCAVMTRGRAEVLCVLWTENSDAGVRCTTAAQRDVCACTNGM